MFNAFPPQYKAILLALIGYSAFACADAAAKWFTPIYNVHQIIVINQLCAVLILLGVTAASSKVLGPIRSLWDTDARKNIKIHGLRCTLNIAINLLLVYAFIELPIATVYTAIFTKPYIAALIGLFFFGQAIGLHRSIAITLGFTGILIAFQPWAQSFPLHLSLILIALPIIISFMFCGARWLKGGSILAMAFWPMLASAVANIPFAIPDWHMLNIMHTLIFILTAACTATGVVCVNRAFQIGDHAAVSPILYIEMLWAIGLGYILFSDVPDTKMLIGSALIIASGIYLILREKHTDVKSAAS